MNVFHFMTIALIWVACYMSDSLFIAMICTFLVIGSIDDCQCEEDEEDEFELTDEDWDKSEKEDGPAVTAGPVFPEEQVADKHVHYLEEPDTVGVFTFDRQNMTWTLVGNMPYKDGQVPTAVATVVPEQ